MPQYNPGMSIFDLVRQTNPQAGLSGAPLPGTREQMLSQYGPDYFNQGNVDFSKQGPPQQGQTIMDLIKQMNDPRVSFQNVTPAGRPGSAIPSRPGMPPQGMPQLGPPGGMPQRGPVNTGAVIDRFEGDNAVVLIDSGEQLVVPRMRLPPGIQAGARLRVLTDGNRILSATPDYQQQMPQRPQMGGAPMSPGPMGMPGLSPELSRAMQGIGPQVGGAPSAVAPRMQQAPVQPFVPSDKYRRMR